MKTTKILEQATILLFITGLAAYMINLVFDAPTLYAWLGVSVVALVATVAEYIKFRRDQSPTLLAEKVKVLEEKLRKKEIEGSQIKNMILEIEFLKSEVESTPSEIENIKSQAIAALDLQQAETEKADAKALEYKAKWENAEAKLSELEAKIAELDKLNKQWAADKSSAEKAFQDSLKITKSNNEQSQRVIDGLEATVSFLEAKQSQYAHATSDLIEKFGYRILTNHWESFKGGMIVLTNKYSTNRLNPIQREEARQELMLTAESVKTFSEFLPQDAEVLETFNG